MNIEYVNVIPFAKIEEKKRELISNSMSGCYLSNPMAQPSDGIPELYPVSNQTLNYLKSRDIYYPHSFFDWKNSRTNAPKYSVFFSFSDESKTEIISMGYDYSLPGLSSPYAGYVPKRKVVCISIDTLPTLIDDKKLTQYERSFADRCMVKYYHTEPPGLDSYNYAYMGLNIVKNYAISDLDLAILKLQIYFYNLRIIVDISDHVLYNGTGYDNCSFFLDKVRSYIE